MMTENEVTVEEIKKKYAGMLCSLDGRPARITGRRNKQATITAIPDGTSYHWSWQTVAYIMENHDGVFTS